MSNQNRNNTPANGQPGQNAPANGGEKKKEKI